MQENESKLSKFKFAIGQVFNKLRTDNTDASLNKLAYCQLQQT